MKRHPIEIAVVFIVFMVPMLFLNSASSGPKEPHTAFSSARVDLFDAVQVHFADGNIYTLRSRGRLYRNNEFFAELSRNTLDFSVHDSSIYTLRPDGLYRDNRRIWVLSFNDGITPLNVHILPLKNPLVYITLSDGGHISQKLDAVRPIRTSGDPLGAEIHASR